MSAIPVVTAAEMARIDRIMRDQYGVGPIQLMEHAGFAVATFARMLFADFNALDQQVTVLAGSGGNGGDALVAARLLHGWGARVTVVLAKPADHLTGLAGAHLATVRALGIAVVDGAAIDTLPEAAVVIDGLLGFSTTRAPTGTTAHLIELANIHPGYVLAIDLPSGMNAVAPCVVASGTVTLGLPKTGLLRPEAIDLTGSLVLVDIGVPPATYAAVGVRVPNDLFSSTWIVPVRGAGDAGESRVRGN